MAGARVSASIRHRNTDPSNLCLVEDGAKPSIETIVGIIPTHDPAVNLTPLCTFAMIGALVSWSRHTHPSSCRAHAAG